MAARVQPCFSAIGLTNSVHPYCRLAIITMQTMPRNNCIQRYDAGRVINDDGSGNGVAMSNSSNPDSCCWNLSDHQAPGARRLSRTRRSGRGITAAGALLLHPECVKRESPQRDQMSPAPRAHLYFAP